MFKCVLGTISLRPNLDLRADAKHGNGHGGGGFGRKGGEETAWQGQQDRLGESAKLILKSMKKGDSDMIFNIYLNKNSKL